MLTPKSGSNRMVLMRRPYEGEVLPNFSLTHQGSLVGHRDLPDRARPAQEWPEGMRARYDVRTGCDRRWPELGHRCENGDHLVRDCPGPDGVAPATGHTRAEVAKDGRSGGVSLVGSKVDWSEPTDWCQWFGRATST